MKIFRTKVFKILDCLIHGRGMLRVNWDREYGPSDIYINKCTLNRVGESLNDDWNFTYSMVFIIYLKNNVAAQRLSPWTHTSRQMSDSSKSRQSHTFIFTYQGQYLHILYIILYMICTNLPFHSIPQESILRPNSVQMLMAYCKKLIASAQ